jgi:hypothetical protein
MLRLQSFLPFISDWWTVGRKQQTAAAMPLVCVLVDVAGLPVDRVFHERLPNPSHERIEPSPQRFAWNIEAGPNAALSQSRNSVPLGFMRNTELDYWKRGIDTIVWVGGNGNVLPSQCWQDVVIP